MGSAAILALAVTVPPPLSLVREVERLDLPPAAAGVRVEARPFTRQWVLSLPARAVSAAATRLRDASHLCPAVTAGADRITLDCTTSRLRVTVVHDDAGTGIVVHRLSVPPWRPEDEGPPLIPFDLAALQMGGCPGKTPEEEGECLLTTGDATAAAALFQRAVRTGPAPLAHLRLGDLALRDDDPNAAIAHWRLARAEAPWGRLATARICELDPKCLDSEAFESVYDSTAVDHALRADLVLRRARLAAFDGQLLEAARKLAAESVPGGACQTTQAWCRRLILRALELPGPKGIEALVAYLELYGRREGPLALELVRAASVQAERAGAEEFGANLLAAATGTIPPAEMEPHLRRVAGLYLAAGDRARADEIVRYARSRLGEAAMRTGAWVTLRRAVRGPPRPATPAAEAIAPDPDLASAQAAVAAARLVATPPARKGAMP
jgi:hypothetical protein